MRVVVAYDGFDRSRFALDEAVRVAREESAGRHALTSPAEIVILSVVPAPEMMPSPGGAPSMRPHAHDDVAVAHAFLREQGVESEMKIAYGDPAEEIVREAKAHKTDLIILGSRLLGPVKNAVLGSVSRRVAGLAPCPVAIATEGRVRRLQPTPAGD